MKYNYVRKKHKPATLTRSNSSRGGLRGAYNDAASNNDYRENKFSAAAGRPMQAAASASAAMEPSADLTSL